MARALYIEIAERYNGRNNGQIPYSVREGCEALHISKSTSKQLLDFLQDRGFIVRTKKGAFSMKAVRDASEWRLTEYDADHIPGMMARHATKDFMRWAPGEPDFNAVAKFKTRFAQGTRTGRPGYPNGSATVPVSSEKAPDGSATVPVKAKNPTPTVRSEVHLQLPGAGCSAEGGERSAPIGSAVASSPPERPDLGSPSREEVLADLERRGQERARQPRGAGGRSG
jgi:hypothetical protein